jgi:hypothetical protein
VRYISPETTQRLEWFHRTAGPQQFRMRCCETGEARDAEKCFVMT